VRKKQAKHLYDMAKLAIKSEKLTPFGGIFLPDSKKTDIARNVWYHPSAETGCRNFSE